MSGIHTSRDEIKKRLEYYRQFKKHGFLNELCAQTFGLLSAEIEETHKKHPQLAKQLKAMLVAAKSAKLALNLQDLERIRSDLILLRNKHHID